MNPMVSPSLNNGALFPAVYLELRNSIFRWMNLEPIIQSEVNQKEKDKYCILIHIYRFRKTVMMILHAGQHRRHRCKEETFGLWEKVRVG